MNIALLYNHVLSTKKEIKFKGFYLWARPHVPDEFQNAALFLPLDPGVRPTGHDGPITKTELFENVDQTRGI